MNIKRTFFLILSIFCFQAPFLYSATESAELNHENSLDYLPDDSLIKQRCKACEGYLRNFIPFLKSEQFKACAKLKQTLSEIEQNGYPQGTGRTDPLSVGWDLLRAAGYKEAEKKAIATVLPELNDNELWQEWDKFQEAKNRLDAIRKERLEQKKKAEEEAQKAKDPRGTFYK